MRLAWALVVSLWLGLAGPAWGQSDTASSRELVVGSEVDYPPFALGRPDGEPGGFTVELWQAVAQQMGLRYRYRVRPFDELLTEFEQGRIDVMINLAQSRSRESFAAFTAPHVVSYGAVFARREGLRFADESELLDKEIIVLSADLPHEYALARGFRRLVVVKSVAEGLRLLASGRHDGMLVGRLAGMQELQRLKIRNVEPVGAPVKGVVQRFAFAVRHGEGELLARINEGMAIARADQTHARLYERWFGAIDPREPSWAERARWLLPAAVLVLLAAAAAVYQRLVARRAEEAARLLRERGQALADAQRIASLGSWESRGADGRIEASPELRRLLGTAEGGTGPQTVAELLAAVHAEDREGVAGHVQRAAQAPCSLELEHRLVRADGSVRQVQHHIESLAAEAGRSGPALRVIGTLRDVTERHRNETLLRDQRRALEMLVGGQSLNEVLAELVRGLEHQVPGAMGGVLLTGPDGRVLTGGPGPNLPAAYRQGLEGLPIGPSEGSCGTACHGREPVIVPDISASPLWEKYRDFAAAHGIRACWSHPILGPGGRVLGALSLSHSRVASPGAAELRLLATQAHLAGLAIERVRQEEALSELNASLEARVAARAAELEQANARLRAEIDVRRRAEEVLQRAKLDAEAASRAKSLFLATMSHEIRTPMNGVVGMVDLLRETALDADQQKMLATVRDSTFSLLRILDDILDTSKIEAGKLVLEAGDFSLRDAVERVAEALMPMAVARGVELNSFVDPRVPETLRGDVLRVRQILFNLLSNAVKFVEAGARQGRASVRCEVADRAGSRYRVRLVVEDNGIGMDDATQARLFTAFTQADGSTTRRFGGTGLGLSICQRLAQMMNGSIRVDSRPGEGSRFEVELDLLEGLAPRQVRLPDLNGVRVLLVMADPERCHAAQSYLEHGGAEVERVGELRQALATARGYFGRPGRGDVVVLDPALVLDYHYPKMKRVALREAFRQDTALAGVRFVVLAESPGACTTIEFPDSVLSVARPLKRDAFLQAVAMAVGRESPDPEPDQLPPVPAAPADARRILVAEDNAVNREVLARQIALLGYAADVTENGKTAFEQYRRGGYALVLTDCHMPEWDGYQLTAAIRAAERDGSLRTPIAAITANALQGEAERCFEAGMDDYIAKPVELPALRRLLKRWLPAD